MVDDDTSSQAQQGYGEVHHVAFRLADRKSLGTWQTRFDHGLQNSGYVDRYYFESLYVRIGHILVELATDEPGVYGDEPYETLGEKLSLAPFLENRREYIEVLSSRSIQNDSLRRKKMHSIFKGHPEAPVFYATSRYRW